MRFSDSEVMTVLTVATKTFIREAVRKDEHAVDIDLSWETMPEHGRQHAIEAISRWVIPALVALPQVVVEAGTRPRFSPQQIGHAISDSALSEATADGFHLTLDEHAELIEQRELILMTALKALPISERHLGKMSLEGLLRDATRFKVARPPELDD